MLGHLPILLNYEWDARALLYLLLVGLPELNDLLQMQRYRSLCSRLHVRLHVDALTPDDTAEYLRYRLKRAGVEARPRQVPQLARRKSNREHLATTPDSPGDVARGDSTPPPTTAPVSSMPPWVADKRLRLSTTPRAGSRSSAGRPGVDGDRPVSCRWPASRPGRPS